MGRLFTLSAMVVALFAMSDTLAVAGKNSPPPPPPPVPPNVVYNVAWIGPPDGVHERVSVNDMNNLGDVVGSAYSAGVPSLPWIWTHETGSVWLHDIAIIPPELGDARIDSCKAINDERIIVGSLRIGSFLYAYAFPLVIDPETSEPIPQPVEYLGFYPPARINNWGDILTSTINSTYNGVFVQLHLYDEGTGEYTSQSVTSFAATLNLFKGRGGDLELNDAGQVVGRSMRTEPGNIRRHYAFLYTSSTRSYRFLPGFVSPATADLVVSAAGDINELGQIVGTALFKKGTSSTPGLLHACLFNGTSKPTDMGVLSGNTESEATDINNAGQVIGFSGNEGFLWTSTNRMNPLENHVLPDAAWINATKIQPVYINDPVSGGGWGEIVGTATFVDGSGTEYVQTFLLTP